MTQVEPMGWIVARAFSDSRCRGGFRRRARAPSLRPALGDGMRAHSTKQPRAAGETRSVESYLDTAALGGQHRLQVSRQGRCRWRCARWRAMEISSGVARHRDNCEGGNCPPGAMCVQRVQGVVALGSSTGISTSSAFSSLVRGSSRGLEPISRGAQRGVPRRST